MDAGRREGGKRDICPPPGFYETNIKTENVEEITKYQ
jgi:hypothetical protein